MKLIIDIHEKDYQSIKNGQIPFSVIDAIYNGTPLNDIRAEIEQNAYPIVHGVNNHEKGMTLYGILQVIDKYRG